MRSAAPCKEPYDSAIVEHGPANHFAVPAHRMGELRTGADFGDELGRGGKGLGEEGRENVNLGLGDSLET